MNLSHRVVATAGAIAVSLSLAGCLSMPKMGGSDDGKTASKTEAPAAAPADTGKPKTGPGMDASGRVTDPKKVESGYGKTVKGINDYEGEITGIPAPGSKFTQLQIGMSARQVQDLLGPPTDQGGYVTGKAFIPFFFGGDRYRIEMVYKGQGRLIFAGSSGFDTNAHLTWIIHSAAEQGYR